MFKETKNNNVIKKHINKHKIAYTASTLVLVFVLILTTSLSSKTKSQLLAGRIKQPSRFLKADMTNKEDNKVIIENKKPTYTGNDILELKWNKINNNAIYHIHLISDKGTIIYLKSTNSNNFSLSIPDLLDGDYSIEVISSNNIWKSEDLINIKN